MLPDLRPVLSHLADITTHQIDVLRLDLLHPVSGGNKYFKLKYNLQAAAGTAHKTILTFGGPFSNHIAATAMACSEAGLKSIGVIRGEEGAGSATLDYAREKGMRLVFVDRATYARKTDTEFIDLLHNEVGEFYVVPEGGSNAAGIKGAAEILHGMPHYDYVLCACGTGTTYAGIISLVNDVSVVVGISVLKGINRLPIDVMQVLGPAYKVAGDEALDDTVITRHCILSSFSRGGYASFDEEVVKFKKDFEKRSGIPLDHVYTAKLFYAVYELCERGKITHGSQVLVIHSGGTQGNEGFEIRYQRRLNL